MSQCKKFAPNIFHKTKCSNCFRQKEEHTAEALECNRASRSIARSGYLFVAPDWDFSVPLNRTKRWQRRWFVLYDDGELNYSVDEHPDTVPQGCVDMTKVLEVTGAEQVTGHPHSLALTSPDRVTFVKAASREDARWWAEILAVFPRRHKRNATFPGGRASPSLPQLGRSASPQPPRPRLLSCTGPSPRTNFETPPLKEERESPPKEEARPAWLPEPTGNVPIESIPTPVRNEYIVSSGSPPTRDKLRCDDKARARRDWRNERLRDIAVALTDRSPESSLALPAEGLLHLKKGWLWLKTPDGEWVRRWVVLCLPTLNIYQEQEEHGTPEYAIELSTVTNYAEVPTENKYGFEIQWSGPPLILSAVTAGIRANWLEALKKAAPMSPVESSTSTPSPTGRSVVLSSDEEYRTASENGRRGSEDWSELPPSPPLTKLTINRVKERTRIRPRLPRCHSRQSTLDSTSTDELDSVKEPPPTIVNVELHNALNKQNLEINDLQSQLSKALKDNHNLEEEIARLKKVQSEAIIREKKVKEMVANFERTEKELNQRNSQAELKFVKEHRSLQRRLTEAEEVAKGYESKLGVLTRELQTKQRVIMNLQDELSTANERFSRMRQENERVFKRLQEIEGKSSYKNNKHIDSLTDLTNIDLDIDIEELGTNELKEYCLDLKCRFEKAILEIRAVKRQLRVSHEHYDKLELTNHNLENILKANKQESQAEINLLATRLEQLTSKLTVTEKQLRNKSKAEARDKRRSLSLKGKESFSINKEVEDKVTELEAKIAALERGRTKRKHKRDRSSERGSPIDDKALRRLRRKSLDSATSSEPLKLLMRLSSLESKVTNANGSTESLNILSNSVSDLTKLEENVNEGDNLENVLIAAKMKVSECLCQLDLVKNERRRSNYENVVILEKCLMELNEILSSRSSEEVDAVYSSAMTVVKQLQTLLLDKLMKLAETKRKLQEDNQLDVNAKMHILAEKIAYENILLSRIQDALDSSVTGDPVSFRLIRKEIKETAHLMNILQSKLNGTQVKQTVSRNSADYLTKVLTKALMTAAHGYKNVRNYLQKQQNSTPSLNLLEKEREKLDQQLESYKSVKLPQLANSLAVETYNLSSDKACRLRSLTEETKNKISQTALDLVNAELIQSEINHVLLRAAQKYQSNLDADHDFFFSFFAAERAALELWSDSVGDCLYSEINRSITELSEHYQNSLNKLQRQNWRRRVESERIHSTTNILLNEFADIIAHKALIDARINVLAGKFGTSCQIDKLETADDLGNWFDSMECWNCLETSSVQINQSLEAEFRCMLSRYSKDCYAIVNRSELGEVLAYLNELTAEVAQLQKQANVPVKCDDGAVVGDWNDICSKCRTLKVCLEEIRCALRRSSSPKRPENADEQHRPVYLGTEYLTQVENLRSAYRCALAACKETHQESDIEKLQMLCERVLLAMEQWHFRTIQELREKHAEELECLRQEKEQALAEETQATLAALDAMRKAHEAEVQKEVAKFKQDFARQQRDEMFDLTERLSVKRMEAAALEEQLGSATRQLAHAQKHILQLERNPQFSSLQN